MVSHVIFGFQGEGCFVSILLATCITRLLPAKGLSETDQESRIFPLPAPPDTSYTTEDIFVVPQNCSKVTVTLNTPDCTLIEDISGCGKLRLASNGSYFCYISHGSSLKSSGPVDVFIKLHSLLLRVPPINQLASSYLYRPFNQATNEICEKLFIYAANDSATLNICSNEFLKINMSSLSDRDIINQKLSRKCFKKTISVDDELLLSGLSRISRLQITSDRPVGILYGLAPSSMPNQSCVSAFEDDEGLVSWHFLPLSSTMGKLFVVVPWARSSDMLVIIIGFDKTLVIIQTPENKIAHNITNQKPLTFVIGEKEMISIEADENVQVQVKIHWHNHNFVYFAQPINLFENSCSNISENTNNDNDNTDLRMGELYNSNLTVLCTDKNVNITFDNLTLTPGKIQFYTAFENKSMFVLQFEITSTNINQIKYPKSKCFFPFQSLSENSDLQGRHRGTKSLLINNNYTVINLESALQNKNDLTQSNNREDSDTENISNMKVRRKINGVKRTTYPLIHGRSSKRPTELSKLLRNRSEDRMSIADENHRHLPDQDNTEETISYGTLLYAANAVSESVPPSLNAATSGSLITKTNEMSGMKEFKVSTFHTTSAALHFPMQDQSNLPADINEGFKIAVDIVQSDLQSGNGNPRYVVKSDMFFTMQSDLDSKNSMAVIISLSAALAAVLLVILVFFLTEVFSRRKYIRNTRIRPSRSFY